MADPTADIATSMDDAMSTVIGLSINTVLVTNCELCTAEWAKESRTTGGLAIHGNRIFVVEPNTPADFEVVLCAPNLGTYAKTIGTNSIC